MTCNVLVETDKVTGAVAIMIADEIQKNTGPIAEIYFSDASFGTKVAIAVIWENGLKRGCLTTDDNSLAMALIAFEDFYRGKIN